MLRAVLCTLHVLTYLALLSAPFGHIKKLRHRKISNVIPHSVSDEAEISGILAPGFMWFILTLYRCSIHGITLGDIYSTLAFTSKSTDIAATLCFSLLSLTLLFQCWYIPILQLNNYQTRMIKIPFIQ